MSLWFEREHRLPQTRLTAIQYGLVLIFILLMTAFWNMQVMHSNYYLALAERNRIRNLPLIAPRGRILDREGRVLVDNYPSFSIWMLRENSAHGASGGKHLREIAEGLAMDPAALKERIEQFADVAKYHPIVIKEEATSADVAFVESHRADLPELELVMVQRRHYPRNSFLAHAIGYVGEVSPEQLKQNDRYRPGDFVGKSGLERQYNDVLMGQDGMRRAVVNSAGKEVGRLQQKEALPGRPLKLTIDYDLQVVAEEAMAKRKGAVVALDPRNGEVLAMVSQPAPDPNLFAVRIKPEDWKALNDDRDHPLLNRAIQAQLAPGSVFKVILAAAAMETKALRPGFSVDCSGAASFYGNIFQCWRPHGVVSFHRAITESCDVFFYNVGKILGIDRIAYYAGKFGLGHSTGIDLPGEEAGLIPSEDWKMRRFKQRWWPGETISVAIGQGAVQVTPIQLARAIGGIASGGLFVRPRLVMDDAAARANLPPALIERFPLQESTVEAVTLGMWGVVNEYGTAAASRLQGIEFCGKTGTAQLISEPGRKKAQGRTRRNLAHNAWFVGFAPRHNPEIVVAVLIEHGEHGSLAATVARDLVRAHYDKKARQLGPDYRVELRRIQELEPRLAGVSQAAE